MHELSGKKITVVGLGVHGGAVGNIRWLYEQGAQITVTDLRGAEEMAESMEKVKDLSNITWVLGEHRLNDFINTDMVLRNPAMSRDSEYLIAAKEAGVNIEMDSSLFFKYCPSKKIIGITGSKGKSTTTNAIAHMLKLKHANVVVVGAEQTSPLGSLSEIDANTVVIFELSSWRLEALGDKHISPRTAVVTSLYRDHLNTYNGFGHYIETKKNIVRYQEPKDRVLLNYDDPLIREWRKDINSQVVWFSLGEKIPGEGIFVHKNNITIMTARGPLKLFSLDTLESEYIHTRRNMLPAIYLAFVDGVRLESLKMHISHIKSLRHRLEKVGISSKGVTYINDSSATIPDATIAALNSMQGKNIILILGGSDKKLDFEELAHKIIDSRIKGLIFLPGNVTSYMRKSIEEEHPLAPPMFDADSMAMAVQQAEQMAGEGDIVLLSPGATSFGHFLHEFDRGDQFREEVKKILE